MKLRTHLYLIVLGTALPIVVLGGLLSHSLIEHERDLFRASATERVRAFTSAVDAELEGHLSTLRAIATSRNLAADDLEAFHAEAVRLMASQPDWHNLTLLTPDGRQIVNARRPYGEKLPRAADRASFEAILTTGKPAIGNIALGPVIGIYGVPVRVPVTREGATAYVLSAFVKPEVFTKLIARQEIQAGWVFGLVDAAGHFVARTPWRSPAELASAEFRAAIRGGPEGWYRGATVEGWDTYTAFMTSPLSGWTVGHAIPQDAVAFASKRASNLLLAAVLGCLVLSLGAAYVLGRRVTLPILSLSAAAQSLSAGQRVVLPKASEVTELSNVAQALFEASQAVHERQTLLEREKAALESTDKAKNEFLMMLSHELRNPLHGLVTATHLLKLSKPGDAGAMHAQEVIERQLRQMTRLVEDLLDVSRIAVGHEKLNREVFDLAEVVGQVVLLWEQGKAAPRRIVLVASAVWIDADRGRIEQILANLLENAEKFSPLGTPIRVRVCLEGQEALLVVSDDGEGMRQEMVERQFGLFVQGDQDLARSRGGLGIGLSLVKRLTEMHGGTVTAQSAGVGQGATFTIRLPAVEYPRIPQAETLAVA